jgi:hypothetical protein
MDNGLRLTVDGFLFRIKKLMINDNWKCTNFLLYNIVFQPFLHARDQPSTVNRQH